MTGSYSVRLVALLILMLFAVSCSSEISVGKATKKKKAADPAKTPVAAPAATETEVQRDYVYTSIGKRDPFRSIFEQSGGENEMSQDQTVLLPLQNYDVNSFVVTAIVWGVSSPTAMVTAPDGNSYLVKNGTLIGRNWGKVVKIKRDSIVVLEQSRLANDMKVSNLIELKLPIKKLKSMENELNIDDLESANEATQVQPLDAL